MENRQGEGKNSVGNVEAKELNMYDPWRRTKGENAGGRMDAGWRGIKGGNRTTVIA